MPLLRDATKFIIHMRHRMYTDNRFGVCIGAGVSTDFEIPTWKKLVERIAEHPQVRGVELLAASESLTAQSQFLFQRYLQNLPFESKDDDDVLQARRVGLGWLRIVHECLYRTAKIEPSDLRGHAYLWALLPLIKKSAMTINYNFDDTVERALYLYNEDHAVAADDKGFETVWQPSSQFRRNTGVIYHPNGFLPVQTIDGFSEQIVFMEQEFADQLVDMGAGHYVSLLNHFAKHTILFIGLSLSDTNLKHLLRVSARHNPGNFHYHIHWCEGDKPPAEQQEAIRKANFSTYNLVTLFLSTGEIQELARLLTASPDEFGAYCDEQEDGVDTEYRYYLTGPVGSGKTTTVEQMRSITTFDEWVDRRHPLLGTPHQKLTPDERAGVDDWVNHQFRKKNRKISTATQVIALVDRSPLDPLYFVRNNEAATARAAELLRWMVPKNGPVTRIAPGHVIVFKCDTRVLQLRLAGRDKKYTEEDLIPHAKVVADTWAALGATVIDTTNLTVAQMVSKVLETLLFKTYRPIDVHALCVSKTEEKS